MESRVTVAPKRKAPSPKVAAVKAEPVAVPTVDVKPEPELPVQAETAAPVVAARAEGIAMMTDVLETSKKFTDEAKAKIETMVGEFNTKAKAAFEKSGKVFEEFGDITKGNVEAMIESGKIAAKGYEAMGQDAAEYGRKQFEKTSATIKSFASVKSPTEFFQLQTQLLSGMFDTLAADTAKSSEAMLKLAGDVAQPISSRVSIVTDKVKSLAA